MTQSEPITTQASRDTVHIAIPKGRMFKGITQLLGEAGIELKTTARGYRPMISLSGFEAKILKPQNIVEMLHHGSRDVGFAGRDWVIEKRADLVELLDTELDPVKIVAAAPSAFLVDGQLPRGPMRVASEYVRITEAWVRERGLEAQLVRSYGATEVFPPEDAEVIVDNTSTGATLKSNQLEIIEVVARSSTRLYANPRSYEIPAKREAIDHLVLMLKSALAARARVMLELNVEAAQLEGVLEILPCMRQPTISMLYGESGYAVKAAVPRVGLPELIGALRREGGTDIVITRLSQIIP